MGAGAVVLRGEERGAHTVGDALFDRPVDGRRVVVLGGHVSKAAGLRCLGLALHTPQEGDDLAAGAGIIGAERVGARAVGDTLFHRPEDRLGIPAVERDVLEGALGRLRLGAACSAPQERDGLSTGADLVRAEGGQGRAVGDLVQDRPVDGRVAPSLGAAVNVGEVPGRAVVAAVAVMELRDGIMIVTPVKALSNSSSSIRTAPLAGSLIYAYLPLKPFRTTK